VQTSLRRKVTAMKKALAAFERATDYGVAAVTTAATFKIASMYDELNRALLNSARPAGLSERERTEYERLLAEQAAPFAQKAIEIHRMNARRAAEVRPDPWIERSVRRLAELQAVP